MDKKYLLLYSSNVVVEGKKMGAIYCLEDSIVIRVPLTFCSVIRKLERQDFDKVRKLYDDDQEVFEEYIRFLLHRKLAFFTDHPECFPHATHEFHLPEVISEATVRLADLDSLEKIAEQLIRCDCKHIVIHLQASLCSPITLPGILRLLEGSTFKTIDLVLEQEIGIIKADMRYLGDTFRKLATITLCGCPQRRWQEEAGIHVIHLDMQYDEFVRQGTQGSLLIVNHRYFAESQSHQPFYNKKVFIDEQGRIRNAIHRQRSFGHIREQDLKQVVLSEAFQKIWRDIPKAIRESELRHCLYTGGRRVDVVSFSNCEVVNFDWSEALPADYQL